MLEVKDVEDFLNSLEMDKIFHVCFVKLDGTVRKMACRRDVQIGLISDADRRLPRPDPKSREHLVTVWEMSLSQYRCFDKKRVLHLKCGVIEFGRCCS